MLLYGPDAGLVRERADALARTVCPDLRDPFRVADLTGAAHRRRPGAAARRGGADQPDGRPPRRAGARCRRRASQRCSPVFSPTPPATRLVVVEAGDLPGRSSLRARFDDAPRGAAIGCYPDSAARPRRGDPREPRRASHHRQPRRGRLPRRASRRRPAADPVRAGKAGALCRRWRPGRARRRAGCRSPTAPALSLDDAVLAAAEGDAGGARPRAGRVFQEGEIAGLGDARAAAASAAAASAGGARRRRRTGRRRAARRPAADLLQAAGSVSAASCGSGASRSCAAQLDALADAEAQIKTTGMPAETICRAALFAIAQAASRQPRSARA